jgi:hypothetical protein
MKKKRFLPKTYPLYEIGEIVGVSVWNFEGSSESSGVLIGKIESIESMSVYWLYNIKINDKYDQFIECDLFSFNNLYPELRIIEEDINNES